MILKIKKDSCYSRCWSGTSIFSYNWSKSFDGYLSENWNEFWFEFWRTNMYWSKNWSINL